MDIMELAKKNHCIVKASQHFQWQHVQSFTTFSMAACSKLHSIFNGGMQVSDKWGGLESHPSGHIMLEALGCSKADVQEVKEALLCMASSYDDDDDVNL